MQGSSCPAKQNLDEMKDSFDSSGNRDLSVCGFRTGDKGGELGFDLLEWHRVPDLFPIRSDDIWCVYGHARVGTDPGLDGVESVLIDGVEEVMQFRRICGIWHSTSEWESEFFSTRHAIPAGNRQGFSSLDFRRTLGRNGLQEPPRDS
jgi:hypothetical protein